jgi:hypothetical protein
MEGAAIRHLDSVRGAFQERATLLIFLKVHPLVDGLSDDLRYDALVKCIGIPD